MIKSKAKADKIAAKQAAQASSNAAAQAQAPADAPSPDPLTESQRIDAADEAGPNVLVAPKEGAADRIELLRSKSQVVGRFLQLMVPILIDVYAASVITPVRVKTLTGLLKAVSFLDADGLKQVLTVS